MASIDDLLAQIGDDALRSDLSRGIAELRADNNGSAIQLPAAVPRKTQREYLLTYEGKQPASEILLETPALPVQRMRAFGEIDDVTWHNQLIFGDNLPVLRHLMDLKASGNLKNADGTDGVRLVYIDPPFASEADYETKSGSIAYSDKVRGAEFIEGLRKRLVLINEILADDGNVFVHLDWRKTHYIKAVMDEVFSEHNFINEIIRCFYGGGQSKRFFPRKHDTILWYAKSNERYYSALDEIRVPYDSNYQATVFAGDDTRAPGKTYKPDERGKIPEDWWIINRPYGAEITGYPTQKPEALLERIISAASKPGDLILDCFAGSGTTLAVAEKLERRWIGTDLGLSSIYTTQKRLLNIGASSSLTEFKTKVSKPKPCCGDKKCTHCGTYCCMPIETKVPVPYGALPQPFAVYSSGHYDFHKLQALPFGEYRAFVLRLFEAAEESTVINGVHIDGRHRGDPVLVYDFTVSDAPVTVEFFDELASYLEGRVNDRVLFVAPSARLAFFEDRITARGIEFEVRRVPYSAVAALRRRAHQPSSKADINKIIETESFDFAIPPIVECEVDAASRSLSITRFLSRAIIKGLKNEERGLPALAMVLVDYDHDGAVFDLDQVFFAADLEEAGWRVSLERAKPGDIIAVSFCDQWGNEHVEVIRDHIWGAA